MDVNFYKKEIQEKKKHILLDVRNETQFKICSLPNSLNIPLDQLQKEKGKIFIENLKKNEKEIFPVFVVCRRGHLSQEAVNILVESGLLDVFHLKGGLVDWNRKIDNDFPIY